MPDIVEQLVLPSGPCCELVHDLLDGVGAVPVEQVARFPRLEEGVRILGGSPQNRMVRGQGALPVGLHQVVRDHETQVIVGQFDDFGYFVRDPEPFEEVQERDPACKGGGLPDTGEVVGFLHRVGRKKREPGLAAGHDVGVVAENRQGVGRHGPGCNVHAVGGQLAGDLVHVRDHEQQALGGGECGAQSAGLQGAVDRTRGSSFGLQF